MYTPSQTVGPYFAYGLTPEQYLYDHQSVCRPDTVGDAQDAIYIKGIVRDGNNDPIEDAMLEIWQNDGKNQLIGRCGTGTNPERQFLFKTLKPEASQGNAPFVTVILFMRGQLIHSFTRIYFEDESVLNEKDPTLQLIDEERRATLIARKESESTYVFDIYMQGEKETVFFDLYAK